MHKSGIVALSILLSGCALPSFTYDRAKAIKEGESSTQVSVNTVTKSLNLVKGLNGQLIDATHNRQNAQVVASEVLFYGTLLTVLGAAGIEAGIGSDAIHARNLGSGLGFGATIFSNRYKVQEQAPVFRRAAQRLACIQPSLESIALLENTNVISASELDAIKTTSVGDKTLETALNDIPRQVVFFVERQTVPDLQSALSAITLAQLSVEEIKGVIEQWENARNTGAAVRITGITSPSPAIKQAITEVSSFSETLQLCRTQNPI